MPRPTEPQISFADWELMQHEIKLDPSLAAISDLLEEHLAQPGTHKTKSGNR
jgi:hypothetical protein